MRLIYNKQCGGFYEPDTPRLIRPDVAVDTDLIGYDPEPWMFKAAQLEMGVCSASEVISEIIGYIYRKEFNGKPFMAHRTLNIPNELFSKAKEEVNGMENASVLIQLFEDLYFNNLEDMNNEW